MEAFPYHYHSLSLHPSFSLSQRTLFQLAPPATANVVRRATLHPLNTTVTNSFSLQFRSDETFWARCIVPLTGGGAGKLILLL